MALFGSHSAARLKTCHRSLRDLVEAVAKETDLYVICGHRDKEDQNAAYALGKSKLKYPHSKHNSIPAKAVDLAPAPLNWDDRKAFEKLSVVMKAHAEKMGINIVWGGDWQTFKDLPHYELQD